MIDPHRQCHSSSLSQNKGASVLVHIGIEGRDIIDQVRALPERQSTEAVDVGELFFENSVINALLQRGCVRRFIRRIKPQDKFDAGQQLLKIGAGIATRTKRLAFHAPNRPQHDAMI